MLKREIFLILFILIHACAISQTTPIEWEHSYGGKDVERGSCLEQTKDGGYIVAGSTKSNDGDIAVNHGSFDVWVLKIDRNGDLEWEKTFGGPGMEQASAIKQTLDGGYILVGSYTPDTNFFSGDGTKTDCLIIKLNSDGSLEWQKTYGGSLRDYAWDIALASDGSYLILANTKSFDGDVTGNHGESDIWLFKLDKYGILQWNRCYGGSSSENGESLRKAADGYIIGGIVSSNDGDVSISEGSEGWVLKIDDAGNIEWETAVGNTNYGSINSVQPTRDGGYIATGASYLSPFFQCYVVKLNIYGTVLWQHSYTSESNGYGLDILETMDEGILVVGYGITENTYGHYDYLMQKLNKEGELQWENNFGGSAAEYVTKIRQTADGGYVIAGTSKSSDFDVSENHGNEEIWVVKLVPEPLRITGDTLVCAGTASNFQTNMPFQNNWFLGQQFLGFSDSLVHAFGAEGKQSLIACYTYSGKTYCDTQLIEVLTQPKVNLTDNVFACEPFSAFICPDVNIPGLVYSWHDKVIDSCRNFNQTGRISVMVYNESCTASDTAWLFERKAPVFNVLQEDTVCLDGSTFSRLTIQPDTFPFVNWDHGTKLSPAYLIYNNNAVIVEVTGQNGCTKTKDFTPVDGCDMTIFVPNAFSPNNDGLNDVFSISGNRIQSLHIRIYNRWGQMIFDSNDKDVNWDGSFQGQPCSQGVYFYTIEYSGYQGQRLMMENDKGIIHLLR